MNIEEKLLKLSKKCELWWLKHDLWLPCLTAQHDGNSTIDSTARPPPIPSSSQLRALSSQEGQYVHI